MRAHIVQTTFPLERSTSSNFTASSLVELPLGMPTTHRIGEKTVTKMAANVFTGNESLRKVTLPDTLKEIEAYSFKS